MTPYHPRPLTFLGIDPVAGFRLKVYGIRHGDGPLDLLRFDGAWALAKPALPQPAVRPGRPGVGFVVLHQGKTGDYLILCWWDRENELPLRVFVGGPAGWRPAAIDESVCVWDLRVLWWEREAYVATALAGRADGVEAYLASRVEGFA